MSCCIAKHGRLSPPLWAQSDRRAVTERPDVRQLDVDAGDGLALHVLDSGVGPPLMLLHGFTGSTETWTPLVPAFRAGHRVITVDLPGHGHSSAPVDPRRYALKLFADDLVRVLDALSIDRVALLGYSMGGRAAIRFALAHYDRLAALVLESTSPGIADSEVRRSRIASDAALAELIEDAGIEAFVDKWEMLPLWESQRTLPDVVRERLRLQRLANRPDGLANSLRGGGAGVDITVVDKLGTISAPTLVVAGALDSRYVELGTTLARSLSDARLAIVPGAGHAVHLEQPEAFADAAISFLRDVASADGRWL